MLNDYDSLWSIQWQPHHRAFDYEKHFTSYYRPLAALNVSVDVEAANDLTDAEKLAGYKLLIAPSLLVQNQTMVEALKEYVAQGGHLVLTTRSGMKDTYNALLPQRQPGGLREIAGVEVEDYYALDEPVSVIGDLFEGHSILWAERLAPTDGKTVRVIARYGKSNGWLDGQIAVSVHAYGNGLVYYVGACLDDAAQYTLLRHILETAKAPTFLTAPGIEICTRVQPAGGEVYIVINHDSMERPVHMPWPSFEHLRGISLGVDFNLEAYGVTVLTPEEKRL